MNKKPILLMIRDGWGYSDQTEGNAIALANTPNWDKIWQKAPSTLIGASGEDVGLPEGQMGNSEVGHQNAGAGRIVYQELTRISKEIREGGFFKNSTLQGAMDWSRTHNSALHLIGLLSDGGVHSHIEHLFALLDMAKKEGLTQVYVHTFLDGRDVPPTVAKTYIEQLEAKMHEIGIGRIATVAGRYYAMDRDSRWERVSKAFDAMVFGEGHRTLTAALAVDEAYVRGENDEFVAPTVVTDDAGRPVAKVSDNDAIIFFNFRPDRARELTRAFTEENFKEFAFRSQRPKTHFVTFTQYDAKFQSPLAFFPQSMEKPLGEVLQQHGLTQLRIAETTKYAHVTYYFSCGHEEPYQGETRVLVDTPNVATFDLKPEMSEPEVTRRVLEEIESGKHDVIILNYANPDMVGHTGILEAAIKAIEAVDDGMGQVIATVQKLGGTLLITADHGNAEKMIDPETGGPFTAHTTNPVPLVLLSPETGYGLTEGGRLADLAPTILDLLGIPQPEEMSGRTVLVRNK